MHDPLPGAGPLPPELGARLTEAARALRAPPRTRHRVGAEPRYTNRLALASSPYLLQHAHNPVAWWPWCDEAFEEARRTGRPVFLSVGYATCHWCHVMEEESFEDEEIAAVLNSRFVPIKVDREERPDVDAVYMAAVQALQGGGGWPMSVFLDADREPFFGATYFPARDGDRGAATGFLTVLRGIAEVWAADPARVKQASTALTSAVRGALAERPGGTDGEAGPPGDTAVVAAVRAYEAAFDERYGGVRTAPKFPSSLPVRLLLRHHRRSREPRALEMAVLTLERMANGGLMDQVGGGFHRYATDARWLVPHFEKMLYDNALLAVAYTEAWQVTGRRDFARVARMTLDYLDRELALPGGAFASATDADSEGEEGRFFVWTRAEIDALLGDDAAEFGAYYGVTDAGNFEGRSILWVPSPDEDRWERLGPARERLYQARAARPPPLRDDKVIAAWNGLAISALARGGAALGDARHVERARRAAAAVLDGLRRDGRLHRSAMGERLGPPGFLSDHAFLAQGLLDLHEATLEPRWLAEALALARETERLFADPAGGWFTAASGGEALLAREKPTHDGAEPSGASVAVQNLLRLAALTGEAGLRERAEAALRWYAPLLAQAPTAMAELLAAVDARSEGLKQVVVVWPPDADPAPLLAAARRVYAPNAVLTGGEEGAGLAAVATIAAVAAGRPTVSGRPTAYVCEEGACRLPAIAPDKVAAQLAPARPQAR